MLVLSRRRGEVIRIGDDIVVTTAAVGLGRATLSIEAPEAFGGTFCGTFFKNDVIELSSSVSISIVEVRGCRVRLGFTAPIDVPVHRQEVYEAINNRTKKKPRRGRGQC